MGNTAALPLPPFVPKGELWDGPREPTPENPEHPQRIPSRHFCYRCARKFMPGEKRVARGMSWRGTRFWYHADFLYCIGYR